MEAPLTFEFTKQETVAGKQTYTGFVAYLFLAGARTCIIYSKNNVHVPRTNSVPPDGRFEESKKAYLARRFPAGRFFIDR